MPRRNRRYRPRARRPFEVHDEPVNYQAIARSLVARGLASPLILGPTRFTPKEN